MNFKSTTRAAFVAASAFAAATFGLTGAANTQERRAQQWAKICSKAGENDICVVQFTIVTPTNQLVTAVNLLSSTGQTNRKIFQVAVPSGRFVPAGVKVKIDNGAENALPYSVCLPDRCTAEIPLEDNLIQALKNGGELTLTSTNFRNQANPVKVTLKGFTAAFDGPPLKANEVESRNKEIADGLENEAEATRQRLREAQERAKSGN
jgi:invasion protein IalB